MINEAISKLVDGQDLTRAEMIAVMDEIMGGEADSIQTAGLLTALQIKGATIEEITASAISMRNHADVMDTNVDITEIVGTGGDKANTFNVSTTSAFVATAAGVKVAKHGNRGVSSKSGAADVLEAMGANIVIEPERAKQVLDETGFTFLFAQKYHTAMKYVGPVRKELGIRTIFNILGPLTNPARATMDIVGVYDESLVDPIAQVLRKLGATRTMVVYGQDVMDEISASAKTTVCEIREDETRKYEIDPRKYGFELCEKSDLEGGDGAENAEITKGILSGKITGPKRNAVVLNSAACIYIYYDGISYAEAIKMAEETIDSGKAMEKLEEYIKATNN